MTYPQQPRKILGMRTPIFVAVTVAAAIVVVCCGGGAALLFANGFRDGLDAANPPTVNILACDIDNTSDRPRAEVEWEISNPSGRERSWTVTVAVVDDENRQVGHVVDGAFKIDGDATVVSDVTVYLDRATGADCTVTVND